jgi:hydroxymethylbilane synthase
MRIGSRASTLALAQAGLVARALGDGEVVPIVTSGDRGEARQDKSRWVAEIEDALAREEVDLAVHSAKDVPGELGEGLVLLGCPARAPAEDVLCGAGALEALPAGARVGTSSLRRAAQLRAAREDLEVVSVRGNVDTRLRRLAAGEGDVAAIVLARAGLRRLGREAEIGAVLDPRRFVPAPGQGILALEGRAADAHTRAAAGAISDVAAFACLRAERALARALDASCNTPLGACATPMELSETLAGEPNGRQAVTGQGGLRLRSWVGLPDGSAWIADQLDGELDAPEALGREAAHRLKLAGALEILRRAEEMAGVARA